MKKLVFSFFVLVLISLCSCGKEKSLNDYRGQVVAMKTIGNGHWIYFKNKAELEAVQVSSAEYDYYPIGDTINW